MTVDTAERQAGALEAAVPAIFVENLVKRYGRTLALDGVSLSVPQGSLFALLGPNGAGKTTLLHILSTILRPDSGIARIVGIDVVRQPTRARQTIGMVFQEPSLDDRLTVEENLEFHGLVYGVPMRLRRKRIDEMLALVELEEWREHLVRSLSSGMKRRLEIARALLHEPRILFLDEPTVGLDAQSRERIWSYLAKMQEGGKLTLVVTTHYIEEVEFCDTVCIIDQGTVRAMGRPEELKAAHGRELIRVVPRSEDVAAAIRSAHPASFTDSAGSIVIDVAEPGFTDRFLASYGSGVSQITFDRPNLESVFLSLTGHELRDKAADQREQTRSLGRRGGEPRR